MVTTNQKCIIDTNTKRERNPNITLNIVIKSQGKRTTEKETKKDFRNTTKIINKMAVNIYLSKIILSVNGQNALIRRHRVTEWIQKQDSYIYCLQGTHFRSKDTHTLKVKG